MLGLNCQQIDVEIDLTRGQGKFTIVGLPSASVREAKARIYSAINNSNFSYPINFHILVNLAPANLPKNGAAYDLAMAIGILSMQQKNPVDFSRLLFVGELALDGKIRPSRSILPIILAAKQKNFTDVFIPAANKAEASLIKGINVYPLNNLSELVCHLNKQTPLTPLSYKSQKQTTTSSQYDMAYVKGHEFVKRGLEIAASGGHNVLLHGPPGSGKTLLSRSFATILPNLTMEEIIEVSKIYSVAGLLKNNYITQPPFRSPHHTASTISIVGGGSNPRPGEISLAHRGVLFLDEFAEFPRQIIESLRQPLEDGVITVCRAQASHTFPARFILLASQNPCPCGFLNDNDKECICLPQQIQKYQKKISGPILDRIDLKIEVPKINFKKISSTVKAKSSYQIKKRISTARSIQSLRFKNQPISTNSEMTNKQLEQYCQLCPASLNLLNKAMTDFGLSARAYTRIIKVSRTIADLSQEENITPTHIAEALQYR